MPIIFNPSGGDVLMCDFGPDPAHPETYPLNAGPCSVAPEMIKRRQVLVISSNGWMVTVAPFSTVAPQQLKNYHFHVPEGSYPFFQDGADNWLKADMTTAVSRERLDRLWYSGSFQRAMLSPADFHAARVSVLHGLALGNLAPHL